MRPTDADRATGGRREPQGGGRRIVLRLVAVASLALGVSVLTQLPAASAAPAATIKLSTTTLVPGQSIMVEGSGWPRGTALQAVLCGSDANNGSTDCAVDAAATFVPFTDGTLHGVLQVVVPPVACPCVVQVTGLSNDYLVKLAVTVVGAPTAAVTPAPVSGASSDVSATAKVEGGSSWGSIFGGGANRTLVVKVHNGGTMAVQSVITARWGGSSTPENVIDSPGSVTVAPGQTRTVSLPFRLDPLSVGSYHVVGDVSGTSPAVTVASSTATWPWGLPLVPLLLVAAFVLYEWYLRKVRARDRVAADSFGPGHAAPGLGALAAMSSVLSRREAGSVRLSNVLLIGELDGATTAVPVAMLTLDSRGIGVTNPSTYELRVLMWASIRGVHVVDRRGSAGIPAAVPDRGSIVEVETTYSTYRFADPAHEPAELSEQVDRIVRLWIRPPKRVPALAV